VDKNFVPRLPLFALCAFAPLALVLSCGCSRQEEAVEATSIKPASDRQTAPEFALKDIDGRTVKLSDYRGKVVLLNFWATWCGPCKVEIPWFSEFENTYKDNDFAVIGVSMDEGGWEDVRPFLQRFKVNYRVVLGDSDVAAQYGGVEALPTSFMIDREGKIASVHVGLVSKSDYATDIQQLLD
jgi:cytochrome c biogenesis protein CcmG/thiol:disulfide interchange protein DsbE